MRRAIILIVTLLALVGCVGQDVIPSMFEEDGSLKVEHVETMRLEWCEYNKGEGFAISQCSEIWESQ